MYKNENLVLVDMANYYIQAMMDNLQEFDKIKNKLMEKVKNDKKRNDKHVRLISDCSDFLFKNKHFEECINLEKWLHQKHLRVHFFVLIQNLCLISFLIIITSLEFFIAMILLLIRMVISSLTMLKILNINLNLFLI